MANQRLNLEELLNHLENNPAIENYKEEGYFNTDQFLSLFATPEEGGVEDLYLKLLYNNEKYARINCCLCEIIMDFKYNFIKGIVLANPNRINPWEYKSTFTVLATDCLKFLDNGKDEELLNFWNDLYTNLNMTEMLNLFPLGYLLYVQYPEYKEDIFTLDFLDRKQGFWFNSLSYYKRMQQSFSRIKKLENCSILGSYIGGDPASDIIMRAAAIGQLDGDAAVSFMFYSPVLLKMWDSDYYKYFFEGLFNSYIKNNNIRRDPIENNVRQMISTIKKLYEYEQFNQIIPFIKTWDFCSDKANLRENIKIFLKKENKYEKEKYIQDYLEIINTIKRTKYSEVINKGGKYKTWEFEEKHNIERKNFIYYFNSKRNKYIRSGIGDKLDEVMAFCKETVKFDKYCAQAIFERLPYLVKAGLGGVSALLKATKSLYPQHPDFIQTIFWKVRGQGRNANFRKAISTILPKLKLQYNEKAYKWFLYSPKKTDFVNENKLLEEIVAFNGDCTFSTQIDLRKKVKKEEGSFKASAIQDLSKIVWLFKHIGNRDLESINKHKEEYLELIGPENLDYIRKNIKHFFHTYSQPKYAHLRENQPGEIHLCGNLAQVGSFNFAMFQLYSEFSNILPDLKNIFKTCMPVNFIEQVNYLDTCCGADYDFDEIKLEFNSCFLDDLLNRVTDCVSNEGSFKEFGTVYCRDPQIGLLSLNTYLEDNYQSTIGKAILMKLKNGGLYLDGITAGADINLVRSNIKDHCLFFLNGILQTASKINREKIYINLTHYDGLNNKFSHEFNYEVATELFKMEEGNHFSYKKETYGKPHVKLFKLNQIAKYKTGEKKYETPIGKVFYGSVEKDDNIQNQYIGPHFLEGFSLEENKLFLPLNLRQRPNFSITNAKGNILAFEIDVNEALKQINF